MLVPVGHHEGNLGLERPRIPVIATDGDQSVTLFSDDGQPVDVVDAGEPLDLGRRENRVHEEEAPVDRTRREMPMKVDQARTVVLPDRPQTDLVFRRRRREHRGFPFFLG